MTMDGKIFVGYQTQNGCFLWTQAISAKRAGAKMIYLAMFDEIDEDKALFKV